VHRVCEVIPNPNTRCATSKLKDTVRTKVVKAKLYDVARGLTRQCTSAFAHEAANPRAEAFVCLFNRCNNTPSLCTHECLYDPALFTAECAKLLKERLGYCRTFDAMNCCMPWHSIYGLPQASKLSSKDRSSSSPPLGETVRNSLAGLPETMPGEDRRTTVGGYTLSTMAKIQAANEAELKGEPIIEPGRRYRYDLTVHDESLCVKFLTNLAVQEQGMSIVRSEWSERANIKDQGYDFVVPQDWLKSPPKAGIFTFTFMKEQPSYKRPNARHLLAERFFGWEKAEV